MTPTLPIADIQQEEISLKDLFATLGIYISEIRKQWKWLLLAMGLGAIGFLLKYKYADKISYDAEILVMLNNNTAASVMGGMLGSLGLGGMSEDASALDKVTVIMKSQDVLGRVLLGQTSQQARGGILANYFIDSLGIKDSWANSKEPILRNFTNFKTTSLDSCTPQEWRGLTALRINLLENVINFNTQESGVLSVSIKSENQYIACELLNSLYEVTDSYYMQNQIGAESGTFKSLQRTRDSVNHALNAVQSRMASYKDRNQGLILAEDQSPLVKMQMEMEYLAVAKGEINKNFEMAKISIQSKQPYLRSLDLPRAPLKPTIPSWKKNMLTGIVLGFFLAVFVLWARKFIQLALQ